MDVEQGCGDLPKEFVGMAESPQRGRKSGLAGADFIAHPQMLFLTDEDIYRAPQKIPSLANLVLQKSLVGVFHILGEVGIKDESGDLRVTNLGTVFYLYVLPL